MLAAPAQFIDQGIGGGGAFYGPSFSPANHNEVYVSSDEGEVFHSKNLGASWDVVDSTQLIASGSGARVEFTNNTQILYSVDSTFNSRPTRSLDGGVTWSRAGTSGWTSDWNSSLTVDQLYADPNDSNRIVITAGNNLYFSNNGGTNFVAKFADATGKGMRGAGAFFDGTNIYVGTNNGLVVSTDNGATFALATLNGNALVGIPAAEAIFSFAGAKQNGTTRFYAVTLNASVVQPGTNVPVYGAYRGVYTLDWGQTDWVKKVNGITASQFPTAVAMSRNDISTAYLAGVTTPGVNPFVDKSTDGGNTWSLNFNITNNQNIVTGYGGTAGDFDFGGTPLGLAVSPIDSSLAFVSTGLTAEETNNGGTLWTQVYVDPSTQNAAGSTTPKMQSYKNVNLNNTETWWVDWADANTIMGAYADVLAARSTNGGTSWGFNYSGLRTFTGTSADMNETYQIITAPSGTLYSANASLLGTLYTIQDLSDAQIDSLGGQIKFSSDKGASWSVLHDFSASVVYQAIDPKNPNTMYASVVNSTTGGIWVTHDLNDGANSTWQRLANQPPRGQNYNHPLTIAVLNDGTLVASYSEHHLGTSNSPTFTDSSGVFVGTVNGDGSVTWVDRSSSAMHYWTKDLVIDPNDSTQSTWYVGVWSASPVQGSFPSNQGGIYKTVDRGLHWTRVFTLDAGSVAVNPANPDEVYVATRQNGLWYSSNATSASATYTQVTSYHYYRPERVFFNPYNTNEIWVASNGNGLASGIENASAGSFGFASSTMSVERNAGQAFLTVTRTGDTRDATSVDYTLSGGTAVSGVDYTGSGGTLTFGAGQSTATVAVTILNSASVGSRTLNAALTKAANDNVLASPTSATLTILDPGLPNLYVNDVAVTEGNSGTTLATFTVSISVPSTNTVTVNYATADNTALAGSDYQATSGTATIAIGSTMTTFTVPVIGNTTPEGNRTFFVTLSNPTNANVLKFQGTGTIVNDDPLSGNVAGITVAGTTNYPSGNLTNLGETIVSNLGVNSQFGNSVDNTKFRSLYNALYDPSTGYAYFSTGGGTNVDPGLIIKVNLNGPLPVEVGWTQAGPASGQNQFNLISGVVDYSNADPSKHYAYFGTTTSPGKIIKVRLNAGDTAPTYIGSLALNSNDNEGAIFGGVIDTTNSDPTQHFAYFGVNNSTAGQPARIVKISLTTDDTFPSTSEVAAIPLASTETNIRRAVIDTSDPNNHYAYFASNQATNPFVVKVKLGSDFRRIGSAALLANEQPVGSAVIDTANGYLYLGTYNISQSTATVVMVATGVGDALPTRVGAVSLNSGQRELSTAVIDPIAGYAYFGDDHTYPAKIYKLKLAAGGILPTEVSTLSLAVGSGGTAVYPADGQNVSNADAGTYGEIFLQSSLMDLTRGDAYFGTDTVSGQVVKLQTSQIGQIKGTKIALAQNTSVTDVRFYSHDAVGNVRLAIYDNSANKTLLWQSAAIANTTANDFLTVPISSGPLLLTAGAYWLAWQVDTTADVPSYTPGSAGDGFVLAQSFGTFPQSASAAQSTSEKWSMYIDYTPTQAQSITFNGLPSHVYGDTPFIVAATASSGLSVSFLIKSGPATFNGATNTVTLTGAGTVTVEATQSGNGTYGPATPVDQSFVVTKAHLTVTANNASRLYGSAEPTFNATLSGFVNGDTLGTSGVGGSASFSSTDTLANHVGAYSILPALGTLSAANYDFTTFNSGTLNVSPAALTITANNQSKAYGAPLPTLSVGYSGFVNGDTSASLSMQPAISTTATSASHVGSYPTTASGAASNDYTISYVAGTLTVNPVALMITADSKSKSYGSIVPVLTASYSGFVNGDTSANLNALPTLSTTATAASHVGSYPIAASGAADPDYTISYVAGSLTVSTVGLTVTADAKSKSYGAPLPTLTASYSGFVNGDSSSSLATQPTLASTATTASHVGSYSVTANGAVDSDYTISYVAGVLTVNPVSLVITANDTSKNYGAALPALTASYSGFVNGDTAASLTTQPTLSTTATAASHVGNFPITASSASSNDYSISCVSGTLSVNPATLTITADNKTKSYGTALPALSASYSGFVVGDTAASLTTQPTLLTNATSSSHVGNYAISASGAASSDYTVSYVAGTLAVTPVSLLITADNQSKAYGDTLPTLTASYSGFVNGDTPATLTSSVTISTTATVASHVGNVPIIASGASDPDYTISYAAGTLTVTPVALTITADDKTKNYGASLPLLTASYFGFVNGDSPANLATLPTLATTATSASHVGNYPITVSGAADQDYTISYATGTLRITPVSLTITADSQVKIAGAALPTLTAGYSGFVNGDTAFSLTSPPILATTAAATSTPGSYPIIASGAVDLDYTINYIPGALTVSWGQIHFLVSAPTSVTAGSPLVVTVSAHNTFDLVVNDYGGTVHLTGSDPIATYSGDSGLTSGVGFFAIALTRSGSQTVTAIDTTDNSIAGTSGTILVNAAAADHFMIRSPTGTPSTGAPTDIMVTALDRFNNTDTRFTGAVTLSSNDPTAVYMNDTFSAGDSGVHLFVGGVTFNTPGASRTITATAGAITGTSNSFLVLGLAVSSFTQTTSGFTATFNEPFNPATLNLYDASTINAGAADVTLVLGANTNIRGSLYLSPDNKTITFIKTNTSTAPGTGGILTAGTYTVTFRSAANGFKDALGNLLDGNSDGTTGDNYTTTFTVNSSSAPVISISDFARGPQGVSTIKLPNNTGSGIPVTMASASGTTDVTFDLQYNPAILSITGASSTGAPSGASFTLSSNTLIDSTHAVASFHYANTTASGATLTLGQIVATVPSGASSLYQTKGLLHLANIVRNTTDNSTRNADGLQIVAYFGDTNGDHRITAGDASLVNRVALTLDTGFAAYRLVDPVIVGNVTASGSLTGTDVTFVNRFVAGLTTAPQIPSFVTTGMTFTSPGPDPALSIPTNLSVNAGRVVVVPVNIDETKPAGSTGLSSASLAVIYNPQVLSVSTSDIHLGSVPASGSGWTLRSIVNSTTGQIGIDLSSSTPIATDIGGSLVTIDFHALNGAPTGMTPINLTDSVTPDGIHTFETQLADGLGLLTLHTQPTAKKDAGMDGSVTIDAALSAHIPRLSLVSASALSILLQTGNDTRWPSSTNDPGNTNRLLRQPSDPAHMARIDQYFARY